MDNKFVNHQLNDIPKIIELFVLVWNQNPLYVSAKTNWAFNSTFKSKVLILRNENKEIISVRGGMQWPLKINKEPIEAYQLHGTCVHPSYRRQGIFSKINKAFISEVNKEKKQLIFNVSVKNSRLGYEKLGWKYLNGFRRLTKFNRPLKILKPKIGAAEPKTISSSSFTSIIIPDEFYKAREKEFQHLIHTVYDAPFLKWRLSNLQEKYQSFRSEDCIIIYKTKYINNLKELIIGDVFMLNSKFYTFKKTVEKMTKSENQDLTYTYIFNSHPYYKYYLKLFFIPNPFNFNLNFGTKTIGEGNDDLLKDKKWGLSFMDIDTF
jgi:hypothetical protein